MNETTGKPAQCTAITEVKASRPGGCVGIFFQLFDWNRRFAKKKLFSRKLLPPARAKQAAEKFGDDKMPKIKPHLIDDEKCGSFPTVKKNGNGGGGTVQRHEMRAAGLVVRLMGLESMPAVNRDKHKKALKSDVRDDKFVSCGSEIEASNSEKGGLKAECRPQKLQKTSQFDRKAMTRFGAEALQIKNVLSRSKKNQYSKFTSPVKSPRLSSSRNASRTSRLIDAATRILEPGISSTNRAKCALPYRYNAPNCEVSLDGNGLGAMPADMPQSCKNCGNLLEASELAPTMEKQVLASPFSAEKVSFRGPEVPELYGQPNQPSTTERFDKGRASHEPVFDGKPMPVEEKVQHQFRSVARTPLKDETSSSAPLKRSETRSDMPASRSRVSPKANFNNLQSRRGSSAGTDVTGAKDFVALNRSLSSRGSLSRVSNKASICTTDTERKFCSRRDGSLSQTRSQVHKKRTASVNAPFESSGTVDSKLVRPKNVKCDLVGGKRMKPNARTVGPECTRARISACNRTGASKNRDVVSGASNSHLRHKSCVSSGFNEKDGKTISGRQTLLDGDSLGALLELKLKELASQEEDELMAGGAGPKRSTAVILQELIYALTAQQPYSPSGNAEKMLQSGGRARKAPDGSYSHDGDYLSPGSVLDASFSNDSCASSNLDDLSARRLIFESTDYSCHQSQSGEANVDIVDSAASMSGVHAADFLNCMFGALQSIHVVNGGLTGSGLDHVKEIILNAELLFSSTGDGTTSLLHSPYEFDDLVALATAMWKTLECLDGIEGSKDGSRVKRFLFDSVIEHLDSKCVISGYKSWRRVQVKNMGMVVEEVVEEMKKWASFSGMAMDEIVEWEMSRLLGKWTDFEIEEVDISAEIEMGILESLVDETVMELWDCELASRVFITSFW